MIQRLRLSHILLTLFLLTSITSAWPWPPSYKDIEGLILRRQDSSKSGKSFGGPLAGAPGLVIDKTCRYIFYVFECISYENIRCSIQVDKIRFQVSQRYSSLQDSQSQWYSCRHVGSSSQRQRQRDSEGRCDNSERQSSPTCWRCQYDHPFCTGSNNILQDRRLCLIRLELHIPFDYAFEGRCFGFLQCQQRNIHITEQREL